MLTTASGGNRQGRSEERTSRVTLEYDVEIKTREEVHLRLKGELAGEEWTRQLHRSLEEHYVDDGVRSIRVDLSGLRFLDSNGVATLIALRRESAHRGKDFTIDQPRGQVREKLRVTGMLGYLQRSQD
jgi:anti-anti-sigma factor